MGLALGLAPWGLIMTEDGFPPVSPARAALGCKCPRCGTGKLFVGFLTVRDTCGTCRLNLAAHDSGDGPAVFIVLILGFVIVGLALVVERSFMPPYWVHALLWPPLIIAGALGMLRPLKALMVALQYRHLSHEFGDE